MYDSLPMFFALLFYPYIEHQGFHAFRNRYEPYANLTREHIPFIFPLREEIGQKKLEAHIQAVLSDWEPFEIQITRHYLSWDHWLMLGLEEGNEAAIQLHDALYTGLLAPHLREDLPFTPHIGMGFFGKKAYDFYDPTAKLPLDERAYQTAVAELEGMNLRFRRVIKHLNLVKLNSDFTQCWELTQFTL